MPASNDAAAATSARARQPTVPDSRMSLVRWTAWFSFANALVLLVVAVRYLQLSGWPETWPARVFLLVAWVGHFATVAAVTGLVAVLFGLAWPNRRWMTGLAVGLFGLVVVAVIVDSIVFKLYRFHLNGMVWSLLWNGQITDILPLSANTWTIAGLIVILTLLGEAVLARGVWRWVRGGTRFGKSIVWAVVAVVAAGQVMLLWAEAAQYTPVTKLVRYFPAFKPLTAKRTLRRLGWMKEANEQAVTFQSGQTALKYPLEAITCPKPVSLSNVVVIVIDGWRFDMLSEAVTPNLWRFSQSNQRFEQHSSVANATRFGIFTLFYGLYGTYWNAMLAEQRGPVLISQLNQAGCQFGIFATAPLTSPEFDRTVFVEVRQQIAPRAEGASVPQRDQNITRQMLSFLDGRDRTRPFFAFVFYDSTHAYDYPPDVPAPFQPSALSVDHLKFDRNYDPVPVRNRFLNAAHYVDTLAAQVLRRLEEESLLDQTVVLITGDHGQEFNDTGKNYWGHNGNFSRWQSRVPLIVHWPGRPPGVFAHQTSHLDIAPTLMRDLLRCATPFENYSNGRQLWDPAPRIPLVAASWGCMALLSPGRIDVMFDGGYSEHVDEDYREISTRTPSKFIAVAMEGMSRFYAR